MANSESNRLPPARTALATVLDQLREVVASVSPELYRRRPDGPFEGAIGGHVRHCLDHVHALYHGLDDGLVDYDRRKRGVAVEQDRDAAIDAIDELIRKIRDAEHAQRPLEHPLEVAAMTDGDGEVSRVRSTFGRELVFVLSHTVHHNAMIGAMVRAAGGDVPDYFGYAPSTIHHLAARSSSDG